MVVAAMQGADQHIRSSLGFSILPKDTLTCRPGEQNKTLAPPLTHSHSKWGGQNIRSTSQYSVVQLNYNVNNRDMLNESLSDTLNQS